MTNNLPGGLLGKLDQLAAQLRDLTGAARAHRDACVFRDDVICPGTTVADWLRTACPADVVDVLSLAICQLAAQEGTQPHDRQDQGHVQEG